MGKNNSKDNRKRAEKKNKKVSKTCTLPYELCSLPSNNNGPKGKNSSKSTANGSNIRLLMKDTVPSVALSDDSLNKLIRMLSKEH
ncbi:MAG: hypothetical protein HY606_10940 [Planctomycetes bacterium]|nr:hypothetical protein [Planctomycetota bacterium]